MKNKYSTKVDENMAKALGKDISISTKMAVEVCSYIRKKNLQKAKALLNEVILMKKAIPVKRYNKNLAHKKKIGPGRYPVNTSKKILEILDEVEANAQSKGLDTKSLIIHHIAAHQAARPWRYGRQRRRKMKRTHVEVIVKEKIERRKEKEEDGNKEPKKEKVKEGKKPEKVEEKKVKAEKESKKYEKEEAKENKK